MEQKVAKFKKKSSELQTKRKIVRNKLVKANRNSSMVGRLGGPSDNTGIKHEVEHSTTILLVMFEIVFIILLMRRRWMMGWRKMRRRRRKASMDFSSSSSFGRNHSF